jgi:hypothetical protein
MTTFVWTDESRKYAIDNYIERINAFEEDQRPNMTSEVVQDIAKELGCTVNGVRSIIMKYTDEDGNSVYVSKSASKSTSKSSASTTSSGKRRSKADSHNDLISTISALVGEDSVDSELISKFTGKAADYMTEILVKVQEQMS